MTTLDLLEVTRFVRLSVPDAPRPALGERGLGLAIGVMLDGVAITVVAIAQGVALHLLLAVAPAALLGLSVLAFNTYSRVHDAQRHLLAVTRRLFESSDAERVIGVVLAGIDTVLPAVSAEVVVEQGERGGRWPARVASVTDGP